MNKPLDLTGQKYNQWTVLSRVENKFSKSRWLCRCDCGTEKVVYAIHLRQGASKSCGCIVRIHQSDYIGKKYGRVTILGIMPATSTDRARAICRCACGIVWAPMLQTVTGAHATYGCRDCADFKISTQRGLARTPEYMAWVNMFQRCYGKDAYNTTYAAIRVHEPWINSFLVFYDYLTSASGPGLRPNLKLENMKKNYWSLDRIDSAGHYEPGNIKWSSSSEQRMNQIRMNRDDYG